LALNTRYVMVSLPKFSSTQLEQGAGIVADIGTVVFASVVLPTVIDSWIASMGIGGLSLAVFFWAMSVWIRKYTNQ